MSQVPGGRATTGRGQAKADRRATLLEAAARLFARNGFDGVTIEDLGSAAGVSGPAVYRHFPSKQAVLAALLVGPSERLLAAARVVVGAADDDPLTSLRSLVRFHVEFALANRDVIRVQDRDLHSLADPDRLVVVALQREYIELWVAVLAAMRPDADVAELALRVRATFGLLNSTPRSARSLPTSAVAAVLEEMAMAALGEPASAPTTP